MSSDLVLELLSRNQGNVLTPELVVGLAQSIYAAQDQTHANRQIAAGLPTYEPDDPRGFASPRLLTNDRDRVGAWVAERVGQQSPWGGFGAIGWLDADGENLIAGAVINNLTSTNASSHVAIDGPPSKTFTKAFFDYAFNQLGLERLTGYVDEDNHAALRFDQHLGYEHEHTITAGNGKDVHMLVIWRHSCKWINTN